VSDNGIPTAFAITGANVQDSQMKIYYLPAIFTHGYRKFKFVVDLALALVSTV
jgi:hypothetical protein